MDEKQVLKILEKVVAGCRHIGGEWDKTTDTCRKDNITIRVTKGVEGVDIEIRSDRTSLVIHDITDPDAIIHEKEGESKWLKIAVLGTDVDGIVKVSDYGFVDVDIGEELEI